MKRLTMMFCALLALGTGIAFAADVTGDWNAKLAGPDGNAMTINYHFKQEGGKLTGTVDGPGGSLPIQNGAVDGEKISFTVSIDNGGTAMKILNEGTVKPEEITITIKVNGDAVGGPVSLKRTK